MCASPKFEIAPFTKINLDQIDQQIKINVIGNHKLLSSLIKRVFRKKKGNHYWSFIRGNGQTT